MGILCSICVLFSSPAVKQDLPILHLLPFLLLLLLQPPTLSLLLPLLLITY